MLVDSHCHLDCIDLTPFSGHLANVLQAAAAQDVTHFLCVSIDLDRWAGMLKLVQDYERISVSVGVHPGSSPEHSPRADELASLAQHPKVVAIGETGLDYFYGGDSRERQQRSFRSHIRAALQANKPLIVHTRDAKEDTLKILDEEGAAGIGGVLHCFTEDWDMAERAIALNFYVSFSGIITFRNAGPLRDVAKRMPAERILVETDSPYLAPVPHRGKSNHPAWVRHVAECVAEVRGETLDEVAAFTTENYFRLFGH